MQLILGEVGHKQSLIQNCQSVGNFLSVGSSTEKTTYIITLVFAFNMMQNIFFEPTYDIARKSHSNSDDVVLLNANKPLKSSVCVEAFTDRSRISHKSQRRVCRLTSCSMCKPLKTGIPNLFIPQSIWYVQYI